MKKFIKNHTVSFFFLSQSFVTFILVQYLQLEHFYYKLTPFLMAIIGLIYIIPSIRLSEKKSFIVTPAFYYAGIITLLSSISSVQKIGISGNIFHPFEFAALSFIVTYSFNKILTVKSNGTLFLKTFSVCFIFAVIDETHQYFVPGRYADPFDILLDLSGIISGIIIYYIYNLILLEKTSDL